MYKKSDTQSIL